LTKKRIVATFLLGSLGLAVAPAVIAEQDAMFDQTVVLTNIEFKPNRVKVSVGDRIRFINKDKFDHDVFLVRTANRNDVILSPTTIHAGKSVIVTVDQEGLFTLYCTIHGGMTGKITTTGTFELTEEEKKRAAARHVVPPIVKVGEKIYWGRGQCHRCHMVGERGEHLRGPNHQDLGFRAGARAKKFGLSSATEYIVQSILEPSAHIVEGYSDDMPNVYQPPINLTKEDITAVVAYLQSQGGTVDTWAIDLNPQTLATPLEPSPFLHGDARRGEKVFLEMGCRSCHTVGDRKGLSVAPDLTAIGAYRNWTWLGKSIVDPNAEVGANWHDATVFLKPGVKVAVDQGFASDEDFDEEDESLDEQVESGQTPEPLDELAEARAEMEKLRKRIASLEAKDAASKGVDASSSDEEHASIAGDTGNGEGKTAEAGGEAETTQVAEDDFEFGESIPGVLRENSAEKVTLLVAPDRFVTFPRDQVARVKLSKGSRMASNYGELMTYQQLSDLVRYLESLKGDDQAAEKTSVTSQKGRHEDAVSAGSHEMGSKK